jgi:hypothetical protein
LRADGSLAPFGQNANIAEGLLTLLDDVQTLEGKRQVLKALDVNLSLLPSFRDKNTAEFDFGPSVTSGTNRAHRYQRT